MGARPRLDGPRAAAAADDDDDDEGEEEDEDDEDDEDDMEDDKREEGSCGGGGGGAWNAFLRPAPGGALPSMPSLSSNRPLPDAADSFSSS